MSEGGKTIRLNALRDWLAEHRALAGRFLFELVIVFVGVSAAFAVDSWRQDAADRSYQKGIAAGLGPTLDDVLRHNRLFDSETGGVLRMFDAELARGGKPALPIFREQNSERPPTRIWDAVVATGAARALSPNLLFVLGRFYTRQASWSERYLRYNEFTEARVLTLKSSAEMYETSGKLRPEFAAHVERLRELAAFNSRLTIEATELRARLRSELEANP